MTATDHVAAIAIFNERNPEREVARVRARPARGPRARVDAHPARDLAEARRGRADERRHATGPRTVDVVVTLAACIEGDPV